jgi:hypothetical protein
LARSLIIKNREWEEWLKMKAKKSKLIVLLWNRWSNRGVAPWEKVGARLEQQNQLFVSEHPGFENLHGELNDIHHKELEVNRH